MTFPDLSTREERCKELADGVKYLRNGVSPLDGCTGALDGICIRMQKPLGVPDIAQHFCQKGFYAFSYQAICYAKHQFRFASVKCDAL